MRGGKSRQGDVGPPGAAYFRVVGCQASLGRFAGAEWIPDGLRREAAQLGSGTAKKAAPD